MNISSLTDKITNLVNKTRNELNYSVINGNYNYLAFLRICTRLKNLEDVALEIDNIAGGRPSDTSKERYDSFLYVDMEHEDPEFLKKSKAQSIINNVNKIYGEGCLGSVQANCFFPPDKHDGDYCDLDRAQDFWVSWIYNRTDSDEDVAVAARCFINSLLRTGKRKIDLTFRVPNHKNIEITTHFFIDHREDSNNTNDNGADACAALLNADKENAAAVAEMDKEEARKGGEA